MEKHLSIEDIADSLKIKRSTVLKWVKEGKFPPPINTTDRLPIWSLIVIEDWINQQKFTQELVDNQDIDL